MSFDKLIDGIEIGWVNYVNFFPIEYFLEQQLNNHSIGYVKDNPKNITDNLNKNKISIALVSSINLYRQQNKQLFVPYGICGDSEVNSAYFGWNSSCSKLKDYINHRLQVFERYNLSELVKKNPLGKFSFDDDQISQLIDRQIYSINESAIEIENTKDLKLPPQVKFTDQSKTTTMLGKILYRMIFNTKCNNSFKNQKGDIDSIKTYHNHINNHNNSNKKDFLYMYIGDQAIKMADKFEYKIDLCNVWKKLTGLCFVFALWQVNNNVLNNSSNCRQIQLIRNIVKNSVNQAIETIDTKPQFLKKQLLSRYPFYKTHGNFYTEDNPNNLPNIIDYWQNKIDYRYDQKNQQALKAFFSYLDKLGY